MKVKELIKQLEKLDGEKEILYSEPDYGYYEPEIEEDNESVVNGYVKHYVITTSYGISSNRGG